MAVQAPYPSNFCNGIHGSTMTRDELQVLYGNNPNSGSNNINGAVFSNQESELTCIGSRKRTRDEPSIPTIDQARSIGSAGTSTSGRPVAHDLVSQLYNQGIEADALIRFHNERLRLALEQAQRRHCRALMAVFEQQALKKLGEKEIELDLLTRRNADLEEKLRRMSAESQIWFGVAKSNEAIVSSLKASLEQVLLQSAAHDGGCAANGEGYGDSDGTEDDARSRNNGAVETAAAVEDRRRTCRACGENDVGVLVLPCRHLCLCKPCESRADTCPVCHVSKDACLQIFMG